MTEVNNIKEIREFLDFPLNTFYFVQIIKRRKENPEMATGQKVIKTYYIDSHSTFDKLTPGIIDMCLQNNARAYINLNKRNFEKVTANMIKYLADLNISKQFHAAANAFEKVAGQNSDESGSSKKWILDIDIKSLAYVYEIISYINGVDPEGNKVWFVLNTKNGYHIITKPFDTREFSKKYNDIEIKKDNPTILFAS